MGRLRVEVIEAKNLIAADTNLLGPSTSDPCLLNLFCNGVGLDKFSVRRCFESWSRNKEDKSNSKEFEPCLE